MALKDQNFELLCEKLSKEELVFYRDRLINQLEVSNKEIANYERIIFIMILAYFLIKNANLTSIQLGPITFNDLNIALALIPPIYTYLLISILSTYNFAEVQKRNLKNITHRLIGISEESKAMISSELILSPFSITSILNYINAKKHGRSLLVSMLFLIPFLLLIPLIFLGFEAYWIYELYQQWDKSWIFKISFITTIWLALILITASPSFIKSSINNLDD